MEQREWMRAIEQTWVVRFPKQLLATFGSTNISYYVVTEPIYLENETAASEGVVRTGKVVAELQPGDHRAGRQGWRVQAAGH